MSQAHISFLPKSVRTLLRSCTTVAMTLALILLFANSEKAKTVYEITTDDATYTVETYSEEVDDVLDEAGVTVQDTDVVDTAESEDEDNVAVSVAHTQYATVTCDGTMVSAAFDDGETTADLLDSLNITMGENDIISQKLNSSVNNGDSIVINRVELSYYDETETSSYDTARVADPDSYRGTEYIKQEGVPGRTVYTYQVKVVDGGKPEVSLYKTKKHDMVTEITAYGTRVDSPSLSSMSQSKDYITNIDDEQGTITTVSGNTYSYSKVMDCTATAYSGGGRTATGRSAQVGVIAVDPSVIPYGTRMYIVSSSGSIVYGTAVAGDCGGSIKGHRIDLYFNSFSTCNSFGVRGCTVYILN